MKRILLLLFFVVSLCFGKTSSYNVFNHIEEVLNHNVIISNREKYLSDLGIEFETDNDYKNMIAQRELMFSDILDLFKEQKLYASYSFNYMNKYNSYLDNIELNIKQRNHEGFVYRDLLKISNLKIDELFKTYFESVNSTLSTSTSSSTYLITFKNLKTELQSLDFLHNLKEFDYEKISLYIKDYKNSNYSHYKDTLVEFDKFNKKRDFYLEFVDYLIFNIDKLVEKDAVIDVIESSIFTKYVNDFLYENGIRFTKVYVFKIFGDNNAVLTPFKLAVILMIIGLSVILNLFIYFVIRPVFRKFLFISEAEKQEIVKVIDKDDDEDEEDNDESVLDRIKKKEPMVLAAAKKRIRALKRDIISNLISSISLPLVIFISSITVHLSFLVLYSPNKIPGSDEVGLSLSNLFFFLNFSIFIWLVLRLNKVYKSLGLEYIDFFVTLKQKHEKHNYESIKNLVPEVREENLVFYNFSIKLFSGIASISVFAYLFMHSLFIGAGAAGVIIGIVAKDSVNNFIYTFQIVRSNMLRIGDWIVVNGKHGTLMRIGLYQSEVRGFDQKVFVVPNSAFFAKDFENFGHRGVRRIKFDLYLQIDARKLLKHDLFPKSYKVRKIVDDIRKMISEHSMVSKNLTLSSRDRLLLGISDTMFVHQKGLENGICINIYCFSNKDNWEYTRDAEDDIQNKILKIIEDNDCQIGSKFMAA